MSSLHFDRAQFARWLLAFAFIASSAAQAANPLSVFAKLTNRSQKFGCLIESGAPGCCCLKSRNQVLATPRFIQIT